MGCLIGCAMLLLACPPLESSTLWSNGFVEVLPARCGCSRRRSGFPRTGGFPSSPSVFHVRPLPRSPSTACYVYRWPASPCPAFKSIHPTKVPNLGVDSGPEGAYARPSRHPPCISFEKGLHRRQPRQTVHRSHLNRRLWRA